MGWAIIDLSNAPSVLQLNGDYIRDEHVQARELTDMLNILEDVDVEGGFVFTFVAPTSPYNANPKFDLDMASYSLLKSYVDGYGITYPDMMWEPKESFNVVAEYYSKH